MLELNLDAFRQSKKEFIESVIEACRPIFDEAFGLDFSKDDCLKVAFSTFENHAVIYENFCMQFFLSTWQRIIKEIVSTQRKLLQM